MQPLIFNPLDPKKARKICIHEAGHWVIAKEMELETNGIRVTFNPQGHSGECTMVLWKNSIKDFAQFTSYLERRIRVLFAGVIAEATSSDGKFDAEYAERERKLLGGRIDQAKINELIHVIRDVRHPDTTVENVAQQQISEIEEQLIQEAAELVFSKIDLIHTLGNQLSQKVKEFDVVNELKEEDIRKIHKIREAYYDE